MSHRRRDQIKRLVDLVMRVPLARQGEAVEMLEAVVADDDEARFLASVKRMGPVERAILKQRALAMLAGYRREQAAQAGPNVVAFPYRPAD